MARGFKDFSDVEIKRELGESAHPVRLVERRGANKTAQWYTKNLESAQEAQIECMTGEIYRYLLGPGQPKIRVQNENTVASEAVTFLSVRNVIEKPAERKDFPHFKKAFCDHIDGFMMVVLSSIFFEENDLSDNNYGLVYTDSGRKEFGGFVKIDHGQSFNTLRIVEESRLAGNHGNPITKIKKSFLKYAEIKYFPPIKPQPQTDWRVKAGRETISGLREGGRKYHLTHAFFDRIVMDFVDGRVGKDYILKLTHQPSISPFYDARLLPIIYSLGDEKYEKMEMAKYWALAKIAFTSETAYLHIAENATDIGRVPGHWQKVKNKICENRKTLITELNKDPDFLRFCHCFRPYIKDRIEDSWKLFIHKRGAQDALSDRYGATMGINPVDEGALGTAGDMGAEYQRPGVIDRSVNLLLGFMNFVESQKWETGFGGGVSIVLKGRKTKVPSHVARLMDSLNLYAECNHRIMGAVHHAVNIISDAHNSTSRSRKKSTTAAYDALFSQVQQYAKDLRTLHVSPEAARLVHPMLAQ